MEPLESYKQFMMHQDESAEPSVYLSRYEEYKKKHSQRLKHAFFTDYKKQEWLQARYSPILRARAEKQRVLEGIREAKEFVEKVEKGTNKFCFDEDMVATSDDKKATLALSRAPQEDVEDGEDQSEAENLAKRKEFKNDAVESDKMLYIRRVPCSCPESALYETIATGGQYAKVYLSDPVKKADYDFDRSAWVLYDTVEGATTAIPLLQNSLLQDTDMPNPVRLQVSICRDRAPLRSPSSASLPARITFDLQQAIRLATVLDEALQNEMVDPDDFVGVESMLKESSLSTDTLRLDAIIGYLRRVHSFAYYAGIKCVDFGDILHTRPALFCRPACSEKDKKDFEERQEKGEDAEWNPWLLNLDERISTFLDTLDVQKVAEEKERKTALLAEVESLEEKALGSVYENYTATVDETGKQRCTLCQKLFKACTFVQKHIKNKHPEVVQDKMAEVAEEYMWQEYNKDAHCPVPHLQQHNSRRATLGSRGGSNNHSSRGRQHGGGGGYRQGGPSRGGGGYRGGHRQGGNARQGSHGNNNHRFDNRNNQFGGPRRMSGGDGHRRDDGGRRNNEPRNHVADPRAISGAYQDQDNMKATKVELDFNVLGSLPPPKKKQKKSE